jgi:hypothetical protein
MTKIKTASVKVMQSYNYCHFEASMSLENDNGLALSDIDDARKTCQRLTDKAVSQYQKAKEMAAKRNDGIYQMQNFVSEVERIKKKSEDDRTVKEIAMLKQYEDEKWQEKFEYDYDYEDSDDDYQFK